MRVVIVAAAAALLICASAVLAQNARAQQNGGGQQAAPAQNAPQGDATAGQKTFLADGCWECHGTVGQGGVITGPRLASTALPFDAVLQQLRTPQNAMPPYEPAILSDTDAANIYAWLKTLPVAPAASSIPLLSN